MTPQQWRVHLSAALSEGLSCLGKDVPSYRVLPLLENSGVGDLYDVPRVIATFGCRGRLIRVRNRDLPFLTPGTLMADRRCHPLIFRRLRGRRVELTDSTGNLVTIERGAFDQRCSPLAVALAASQDYVTDVGKHPGLVRFSKQIFRGGPHLWRVLGASALIQIVALTLPFVTRVVVDQVLPEADWSLLVAIGGLAVPLFGVQFLGVRYRARAISVLRSEVDVRLQVEFVHHLMRLPLSFFLRLAPGDIVARITSQNGIRDRLTAGVIAGVLDTVVALMYLAVLALSNWMIALVASSCAALQVLLLVSVRGSRGVYWDSKFEAQRQCNIFEHEMVSGIETVRSGGYESAILQYWENLFTRLLNIQTARWDRDASLEAAFAALKVASPFVVLISGVLLVLDSKITLGSMMALSSLAVGFLLPLAALVENILALQILKPNIEKVRDVFQISQERPATENVVPFKPQAASISLEGVGYSVDGTRILDDLSMEIGAGQFVAIVGRSGAGKSTLLRLILGLLGPERGQISFGGNPFHSYDAVALRSRMGVVTQTPALFSMSVRENIGLGDPSLHIDEIVAAARVANVHDEIMNLARGYDTRIGGDRATVQLSLGQRQRIALARALVRRPCILILDEATSAVDSITEASIQTALSQLECTRIVVAHRLSTVRDADRIYVLKDGRLVESGTHNDLVDAGRHYWELVQRQVASGAAGGAFGSNAPS